MLRYAPYVFGSGSSGATARGDGNGVVRHTFIISSNMDLTCDVVVRFTRTVEPIHL